jgi:hypothetical protein
MFRRPLFSKPAFHFGRNAPDESGLPLNVCEHRVLSPRKSCHNL